MNNILKKLAYFIIVCALYFTLGCAQVPEYCGVNYDPIVNWRPDPNIGKPHRTPYTGTYFLGNYYSPICTQPPNGPKYWETGFPIKPID